MGAISAGGSARLPGTESSPSEDGEAALKDPRETPADRRGRAHHGRKPRYRAELTRRLLSEGFQVIALNRSGLPEDDPPIREGIERRRLRVHNAICPISRASGGRSARSRRAKRSIDVLFNNAGGSAPS